MLIFNCTIFTLNCLHFQPSCISTHSVSAEYALVMQRLDNKMARRDRERERERE